MHVRPLGRTERGKEARVCQMNRLKIQLLLLTGKCVCVCVCYVLSESLEEMGKESCW